MPNKTTTKGPLLYLAGPISKGNPFHNVATACILWAELNEALGNAVIFCPHWSALQDMVVPDEYEVYMAYDFRLIQHCHALIRIPGDSPGADREEALANKLGIPVFSTNNLDAISTFVSNWKP